MRTLFNWLLLPALVLSLAACDSNDDDDDNGNGNYGDGSVTVTGDVEASFSGDAAFTIDDDGSFILVVVDGNLDDLNENTYRVVGFVREAGRPAQGQYELSTDGAFSAAYVSSTSQTQGVIVFPTSGEINVTSSSSSEVRGTFTFTGMVFDTQDPQNQELEATVSGSFEAPFVENVDTPVGRPAGRLAPAN